MADFFKSKRNIALVAGLAFYLAKAYVPNFPFSEEQVLVAVGFVATWILGDSIRPTVPK